MFSNKLRRLFAKLNVEKDMKIQSASKKKLQRKQVFAQELPDSVWNLVFDYSSPFDVMKWRRVNKQMKRVVDNRVRSTLYLDVLRMDITQILPRGVLGDGDFFRHPTCNLLAHHEHRSILFAAHSQWTSKEAEKLCAAIQFYGKFVHTVTLDSSIAELCVGGQSTTDIGSWFTFQVAAGGTDPTPPIDGIEMPGWLQSEAKFNQSTYRCQLVTDLPEWNPRTHRIPLGPLFPNAKEITFRCTLPQLRRMRRLAVYHIPATLIFSPEQLQVFRLSIIGSRNKAPSSLKLRPFFEWLDADQLGNKLCIQFC
uniref:F-box domain-containing protein n=1 Tax=Haemonchus contortus TaxID=6289 RepID=A0A7I4YUQ0_HAECO|nr:Cyclin F-box domain containing protein [Haemonchus contortus]